MSERRRQADGTVVRGADGSLYFIPADEMKAHKLRDEDTAEVRSLLDEKDIKAHGTLLPAFQARAFVNEDGDPDDSIEAVFVKKLPTFPPKKVPRS